MNPRPQSGPADRCLATDGTLLREGSLSRVAQEFAPVVAAAREQAAARFGARLHSAYLYGRVPRGTAVAGVSDLVLARWITPPKSSSSDQRRSDTLAR